MNKAAEFIPEEKEAAIRLVEDISGLFADEPEVDGDENSAGLDRGEIGFDKRDGVIKEGGDFVAFFQPETKKRMGQLIHPAVEDPVGKSLLAADQGGVFRVFTRRQRQNLPHIHIGNQPPESNSKPTSTPPPGCGWFVIRRLQRRRFSENSGTFCKNLAPWPQPRRSHHFFKTLK